MSFRQAIMKLMSPNDLSRKDFYFWDHEREYPTKLGLLFAPEDYDGYDKYLEESESEEEEGSV